jgi:ADP-ribose pyrophosphatase YjhB (NUDIX family)
MSTSYSNPVPTVDACIDVEGRLVLIKRKFEPLGWALPGGFVDAGEDLATACVREAKEETDLDVELITQLWTYSDPRRDKRKHTISTVFAARAHGQPSGKDDAAEARLFSEDEIPWKELAFDHAEIVRDYLHWKKTGQRRSL